jgi:hypothetical protein
MVRPGMRINHLLHGRRVEQVSRGMSVRPAALELIFQAASRGVRYPVLRRPGESGQHIGYRSGWRGRYRVRGRQDERGTSREGPHGQAGFRLGIDTL